MGGGVLVLLTFGGGGGGVLRKIEGLQILHLRRLAGMYTATFFSWYLHPPTHPPYPTPPNDGPRHWLWKEYNFSRL